MVRDVSADFFFTCTGASLHFIQQLQHSVTAGELRRPRARSFLRVSLSERLFSWKAFFSCALITCSLDGSDAWSRCREAHWYWKYNKHCPHSYGFPMADFNELAGDVSHYAEEAKRSIINVAKRQWRLRFTNSCRVCNDIDLKAMRGCKWWDRFLCYSQISKMELVEDVVIVLCW